MKLRYSPTSPYVRKVTITAIETGLDGRIERVPTNVWDPATDLIEQNPLGKVPTLITDDGLVLIDSAVICEYLDSLHNGRKLFPASGPARWREVRLMALANGILDAGVARLLETRRPEQERSAAWMDRQAGKISRGLDVLEGEVATFNAEPTIGTITVGCCLGFFEFRFPAEDWRIGRPMLADWYAMFLSRPSMAQTMPKEA